MWGFSTYVLFKTSTEVVAHNRVVPAVLRHWMHESCALTLAYASWICIPVCNLVFYICHCFLSRKATIVSTVNRTDVMSCFTNACSIVIHHSFTLLNFLTVLGTICLLLTCFCKCLEKHLKPNSVHFESFFVFSTFLSLKS